MFKTNYKSCCDAKVHTQFSSMIPKRLYHKLDALQCKKLWTSVYDLHLHITQPKNGL